MGTSLCDKQDDEVVKDAVLYISIRVVGTEYCRVCSGVAEDGVATC